MSVGSEKRWRFVRQLLRAAVLLALVATVPYAQAGDDPNDCDAPGDYPDVIVGNLHQTDRYGPVGDITNLGLLAVERTCGTAVNITLDRSSSSSVHATVSM